MFRRIIREAFQSVEWGETEEERHERAHRLGEAILLLMIESVEEVKEGGEIGEEHIVRNEPGIVEELLNHLESQGLKIEVKDDREVSGERLVELLKLTQASNDKTQAYLNGKIVDE